MADKDGKETIDPQVEAMAMMGCALRNVAQGITTEHAKIGWVWSHQPEFMKATYRDFAKYLLKAKDMPLDKLAGLTAPLVSHVYDIEHKKD